MEIHIRYIDNIEFLLLSDIHRLKNTYFNSASFKTENCKQKKKENLKADSIRRERYR